MYSNNILKRRILIIGANGMLGQRSTEFFMNKKNVELLACSVEPSSFLDKVDYVSCDISDREKIKKIIYDFYPDYILNAAAFTNVDLSESKRELAWKINVKGVEYIAEAARVLDAHIIHISSDYIFDGKNGPYDENAVPNPIGYYGRTKLASENALKISGVLFTIFRTNVLFGTAVNARPDFVKWVISSLKEGRQIKIVTDQINNPTFIDDLVQAVSKAIEFKKTGIYNIGGREFLSRYQFTEKIIDYFKLDKSLLIPIKTCELNQPANRPLKSGLITIKAETELGYRPHSLNDAFAFMKKELQL